MRNKIGRKVEEFRIEATELIARTRRPANYDSAGNTGSEGDLNFTLRATNEEFEKTIEELVTALGSQSELVREKIARHPLATVAVAFAIGVLIGRLSKQQE
jgi:ElaB/YqjD/DUF883 family membrane-anchored ribosome-binding protein